MIGAPRPGVLRARFDLGDAPGPFEVRPVVLRTEDDRSWDGLSYTPHSGGAGRRRLAVLVVHGSIGNYLSGLPRRLSFGLARAGFPVLAINTRMANYGLVFGDGLFHRTPLDLDAGVAHLVRSGYRRIVLCGFSMGATMVVHHQVARVPPPVVGVLTVAHPASLPGALRRRWEAHGARPSYGEMAERARRALGPDMERGPGDRVVVVERSRGPTARPEHAEIWSYRTWWFSRGPEATHAVSELQVGDLRVPLAIVQAGQDELIGPDDGPALASRARAGDCPSVLMEVVPGASHTFAGREAALVDACVGWLDNLAGEPAARVGVPAADPTA